VRFSFSRLWPRWLRLSLDVKNKMNMPENRDDLLKESVERCRLLSDGLPKRVDPASISYTAKIPFKAMDYREALIWRTEELARTACEMFVRDELASAVTLTRACMETVAAMWYLKEKIQHVIDTKEVGDINDVLMRLLMGSKNDITDLKKKGSVRESLKNFPSGQIYHFFHTEIWLKELGQACKYASPIIFIFSVSSCFLILGRLGQEHWQCYGAPI